MSEKIKPHHLQRKAILYIRQSSAFQVQHNQESGRLQYAMKERLQQLGWQDVEIIDEDLGRSGAGTILRHGFERMVADVCLGKVGAVAAREVSRFARNSREWQQLVEMCRVVDTLLIDQDTVYAPRAGLGPADAAVVFGRGTPVPRAPTGRDHGLEASHVPGAASRPDPPGVWRRLCLREDRGDGTLRGRAATAAQPPQAPVGVAVLAAPCS